MYIINVKQGIYKHIYISKQFYKYILYIHMYKSFVEQINLAHFALCMYLHIVKSINVSCNQFYVIANLF